jgi:4-diphosphocytidyl-2-C-methyl-D-erythritol kinase
LQSKTNAGLSKPPETDDPAEWTSWLSELRNDLEPPARLLASRISELSGLMKDSGATLVRMSGSGASCFALFENAEHAEGALEHFHAVRPDWYFMLTETVAGKGATHGRA